MMIDIKVMRNKLETYVYDMRAALDTIGNFKDFMNDADREQYLEQLNLTESWIYDEGESAAKAVYEDKLKELQAKGEPVKLRYRFHDSLPFKSKDFQDFLADVYQKACDIPADSHITAEEKEKLLKL